MGVVLLFLVLLQLQFCAADDNLERKLMKEMEKLLKMVNILTSRVKSREDEMKRLRRIVHSQRLELNAIKLQHNYRVTKRRNEKDCDTVIEATGKIANTLVESIPFLPGKSNLKRGGPNIISNDGPVAFYAYMSNRMTGVGTFHTLMFDVVQTNVGNAFHQYTGIFMVPKSGLYVFTWSFRLNVSGSSHTVEIVVNNAAVGKAFGIVGNGEHDQTSATVVIYVQKGDDVFLRTGGSLNNGQLYSDSYGYTYFAGWSLQ